MIGGALERLVDWVEEFIGLFKFWVVLDEYERGIRLTLGIRRKWFGRDWALGPGWHFVLPLGFEEVLVDNVVPQPETRATLTLTTKDGKTVAITPVASWAIIDLVKFTLEVEDGDGAMDLCIDSVIARWVADEELKECYSEDFWYEIEKQSRRKCKRFGIKLDELTYSELYETTVSSNRILGELDLGDIMGFESEDE